MSQKNRHLGRNSVREEFKLKINNKKKISEIKKLETEIKKMKKLKTETIEHKSSKLLGGLNMVKGTTIEEIKEI